MTEALNFRGVAHPPPPKNGKRKDVADLSAAEIHELSHCGANMGNNSTNVLVEHNPADVCGTVDCSFKGPNGELMVSGTITDPTAIEHVRTGKMRGLSLGTSMLQNASGKTLLRSQDEISICEAPKRAGCWISNIDGVNVRTISCASAKSGTLSQHNVLNPCT